MNINVDILLCWKRNETLQGGQQLGRFITYILHDLASAHCNSSTSESCIGSQTLAALCVSQSITEGEKTLLCHVHLPEHTTACKYGWKDYKNQLSHSTQHLQLDYSSYTHTHHLKYHSPIYTPGKVSAQLCVFSLDLPRHQYSQPWFLTWSVFSLSCLCQLPLPICESADLLHVLDQVELFLPEPKTWNSPCSVVPMLSNECIFIVTLHSCIPWLI